MNRSGSRTRQNRYIERLTFDAGTSILRRWPRPVQFAGIIWESDHGTLLLFLSTGVCMTSVNIGGPTASPKGSPAPKAVHVV